MMLEFVLYMGFFFLVWAIWWVADDICRALRAPKEITVNVHFVDDDECCCDCDEDDDE
jgi:hypothetical protein